MKSLLSLLVLLSTVLSLSLPAFAQEEDTDRSTSVNPGAEPNDSTSGKVGMTKQEAASIALGLYPDCPTCQKNLVQKLLGAQTTKKEDYTNLLPAGYKKDAPAATQKGSQ